MPLHLVRHAKAGTRQNWPGDDLERPLTAKGREQAKGIAKALEGIAIGRVLSSPYTRCVQTVSPLADNHGREIELTDALAEGAGFARVVDLLADVPDESVLCTHGDLLPDTIE